MRGNTKPARRGLTGVATCVVLGVVLGAVPTVLPGAGASAQTTAIPPPGARPTAEQIEQFSVERDRVFEALRARPDDLDLLFRYAQISQAMGDLEGAIGTYERMLIYNPDLPRVRLELALLYYRLGSFAQSRAYLGEVLARPDLPDVVRRNAELLLADIELREGQTPSMRFYGALFGAIRWQNNANAGPDSRIIEIGGLEFLLSEEATGQEDFSALLSARLGNYIPITPTFGWRSVAQAVYADYFRLNQLDQISLRADTGPQFLTSAMGRQLTIWPYAFGEYYWLGGDSYFGAGGGGVSVTYALSRTTSLIVELEAAYRDYYASATNQALDLRDGAVYGATATLFTSLDNGFAYSFSAEVARTDADAGFYSATRYGATVTAAYRFDPGFGIADGDWRVGARGSVRLDQYDDPDPMLDPETAREDILYGIGGYLTVPVFDRTTLVLDADWRHVDSNYALYAYTATTLTVGLRHDF